MASPPIRRIPGPIKICYDCDHELYPNGKIIFDDPLAKQDRKGFDRAVYGNKKNISKRKWRWFEELRQEKERDINIEMSEKR